MTNADLWTVFVGLVWMALIGVGMLFMHCACRDRRVR